VLNTNVDAFGEVILPHTWWGAASDYRDIGSKRPRAPVAAAFVDGTPFAA
jgi:hypothetical protein